MIAYNKVWLDNMIARDSFEEAFNESAITKEEKVLAEASYPVGLYTPNYFIRLGLFILTCIIAGFSLGLVCLVFAAAIESAFSVLIIFFGIGAYLMLEYFVRTKHHYRSGVDDALLWIAFGSVFSGIAIGSNLSESGCALVILVLAAYLTLRFADMLMAAVAVLALLALIFLQYSHIGNFAKGTTPFLLMAVSAVIYLLAKKIALRKEMRHYFLCNMMVQIVALACFYAAGNYFIVREVSNEMFGLNLQPNQPFPYGWLFWIFTGIIPVLYIARGLQKKDAVILRVGLLLIAAIVFTIRYYHTVWPIETLMLFGGIFLTALAYALTRWLAKPRMGFTSAEGKDKFLLDKVNVEALVIAETFGQTQPAPGTRFGGGDFGGGGASGEF